MVNYFIRTYGCQANVADSESISKYLTEVGCAAVEEEKDADVIIVNTCAVREKAEHKLFSYLGELGELKETKPYIKLGVIGCVASYRKNEFYKRFKQVNFVYGAREEIPALLAYLSDLIVDLETKRQLYENNPQTFQERSREKGYEQDRDIKSIVQRKNLLTTRLVSGLSFKKRLQDISGEQEKVAQENKEKSSQKSPDKKLLELKRSFINIMTGCNKYCTYCIVPFTRGREVSYSMPEILERIAHDVSNGAKEVNLVGQNVNSYKDPESGAQFPELLRRVAQIDGEFWVRYISPHPQDMTKELFEVMAEYRPKLTGYVHFPLQSGSDKILDLMNRNYTASEYLAKIAWVKELLPDATLSTDIIVGFPGETEEDYQATRNVMEQVKFDIIYSFIYSPRQYTKAFKMEETCSAEEKSIRLEALQKRQIEICLEQNSRNIGKTLQALVEKRLTNDKLLARTEGNVRVLFAGSDDLIGTFVKLNITKAGPVNLEATLI